MYTAVGRVLDPDAYRIITQQWVDKHMALKEQSFTKPANCNIFCATWNVNAKKQEEGLDVWLTPDSKAPLADIYAIGFQEIVDLNAMNVALNSSATQQKAQFWIEKILSCLNSKQSQTSYQLVAHKTLVGLLLGVFAKEPLVPHIKDVRTSSLGVGIMGMMGNKGGVSVRMSVYDTTICFVCAHLAAHRENVQGRNSDFKNIYDKTVFAAAEAQPGDDTNDISSAATATAIATASSATSSFSNAGASFITSGAVGGDSESSIIMPKRAATQFINMDLRLQDHDIIFWFGDLNYRIDDSLTTEQVFHLIETRQFEDLRLKDQLNIEHKRGAVFQNFSEGRLNFPPTYKYQPGTDKYETRAEKKLRAPAWCDRVLWKCSGSMGMVRLWDNSYRCAALNPSDHKPVSAGFKCELRTVVEEQQKVVFDALMLELARFGGGVSAGAVPAEPEVVINRSVIRFERIKYMVSSTDTTQTHTSGRQE